MRYLLAVLLCSQAAFGAWVTTNQKQQFGTTNPVSTPTFAVALTNPSLIIVGIWRVSSPIVAPTDTAGNTYVDCGTGAVLGDTSTATVKCYYALNTSTITNNVVTEADTVGDLVQMTAIEETGGATSSPVRAFATNPNQNSGLGGGQNVTTTAISATSNGDLIFAKSVALSGALTAGPGFTLGTGDFYTEWKTGTGGSITATWSDNTNSDVYGALAVAFKPFGSATSAVKHRVVQ